MTEHDWIALVAIVVGLGVAGVSVLIVIIFGGRR